MHEDDFPPEPRKPAVPPAGPPADSSAESSGRAGDAAADQPAERSSAADWTDATYPLCDADFVDETLEQVLQERDAAESGLSAAELQAFAVPAPSPDFVERCFAEVRAQQTAGTGREERAQPDSDAALHALLHRQPGPTASADFVEQTLRAVLAARQDRAARSWPQSRLVRWASVAALLLCGVVFFWPDAEDGSPLPPPGQLRVQGASFSHSLPLSDPGLPLGRQFARPGRLGRIIEVVREAR